ncbi:MAG TPA: S1/P1 nuclease [Patescibacteria group bacterium]|nr:S1/P1 nuclease [Patescibacteria group bacterium]
MRSTGPGSFIAAVTSGLICLASWLAATDHASAWGDQGHEIIGLIADHYLDPAARDKVDGLLSGDRSGLTPSKDIAREATWADKYRDSDRGTSRKHYLHTHDWHFVDLELDGPDLAAACFGRRPLPPGTVASNGPAQACVVDKIDQFTTELASPATGTSERRKALQFLLHFVGDVHQPLHASDDHDMGGNDKTVSVRGIPTNTLHHYWDTEFVIRLGANPSSIARLLIGRISEEDRRKWSSGTAGEWASESFHVAGQHAYGLLPASSSPGHYKLSTPYVNDATEATAEQLSKAGVRLAFILNQALR